jgi:putative oxidoreductase
MIVAIFSVHINKGFFGQNGGYEYSLLLATAALTIALTGPGSLSLDEVLGNSLSGLAAGLAALFLAILASVVLLAQRRTEHGNVK